MASDKLLLQAVDALRCRRNSSAVLRLLGGCSKLARGGRH